LYSEYYDSKYISSYEIFKSNKLLYEIKESVNRVGEMGNCDYKGEQFISVYDKNKDSISEEKIYGSNNFINLEKILNIIDADIWDEGGGNRTEEEQIIIKNY